MIATLCFYLYSILVFLKTLATTSYAWLVYYVLHVASPRINEAKYFIISHVACKYIVLVLYMLLVILLSYFYALLLLLTDSKTVDTIKHLLASVERSHYESSRQIHT